MSTTLLPPPPSAARPRGGLVGAAATVPRPAPTTGARRATPRIRRLDIEGLRAVAVLAVLLYHAGVPGFGGGFVGVDVFFVISGFLITWLLMGEVRETGRLDLAGFYARRAVRILPPAALVLVATAVVMPLVFSPLRVVGAAWDLVSAAGYVVNWRFISEQTDYMHAGADPSPILHFWSLAVEEQFYLVWPVVVLGAGLLARRSRWTRAPYAVAFLVLGTASFLLSLRWTFSVEPLAYMSSVSRAWEFAAGGLVAALAAPVTRRWLGGLATVAGWIGLAAIGYACVRFSDATSFPGYAALVPVAGTATVILAGSVTAPASSRWSPGTLLGRDWPVRIGRLSYSWYLWHWPPLVLVEAATGPLSWPVKAAIVLGSGVPAWLSLRFFEEPLRLARAVQSRAAHGIAIGLTGSLIAGLAALLGGSAALNTLDAQEAGAATAAVTAPGHGNPLAVGRTSGPVTPSPAKAALDTAHTDKDCFVSITAVESPRCLLTQYGDPTSAQIDADRVVLLGDSHANQWFSVAGAIAAREHWSVEAFLKPGCPVADVRYTNAETGGDYQQCYDWKSNVFDRLESEPAPKLILVGSLAHYVDEATTAAGWTRTIDRLQALGAPIVYLRDNPFPGNGNDIASCMSEHLDDWTQCSFQRTELSEPLLTGTPGSHGLAGRVDLDDWLCPHELTRCPAALNGVLLYQDDSHVTDTAASLLAPFAVQQLVDQGVLPTRADPAGRG